MTEGAVDGFILGSHVSPAGLDEVVDRVVPEPRDRGLLRSGYSGTTLRSARRTSDRADGRADGLPLIFSSFHATYGATEEARRLLRERRESIDFDRGRAQVADMLGGGVDLAALAELPLDAPLPESLLPDVRTVNRRRGRVDIFAGYVRQGYTLRELVVAAQDTGHWAEVGTPEQLADRVEERFRAGVLDVISLNGLADPRQHELVVDGLLAELRRRGIVADDYEGTTLRENLGLELPARRPVVRL